MLSRTFWPISPLLKRRNGALLAKLSLSKILPLGLAIIYDNPPIKNPGSYNLGSPLPPPMRPVPPSIGMDNRTDHTKTLSFYINWYFNISGTVRGCPICANHKQHSFTECPTLAAQGLRVIYDPSRDTEPDMFSAPLLLEPLPPRVHIRQHLMGGWPPVLRQSKRHLQPIKNLSLLESPNWNRCLPTTLHCPLLLLHLSIGPQSWRLDLYTIERSRQIY